MEAVIVPLRFGMQVNGLTLIHSTQITSFGHKNSILSLDSIGQDDFISSGFDRQNIYWKLEDESQMIF